MTDEEKYYIENKICVACAHWIWGMGEMGYCKLIPIICCTDVREWNNTCSNGMFIGEKRQCMNKI